MRAWAVFYVLLTIQTKPYCFLLRFGLSELVHNTEEVRFISNTTGINDCSVASTQYSISPPSLPKQLLQNINITTLPTRPNPKLHINRTLLIPPTLTNLLPTILTVHPSKRLPLIFVTQPLQTFLIHPKPSSEPLIHSP